MKPFDSRYLIPDRDGDPIVQCLVDAEHDTPLSLGVEVLDDAADNAITYVVAHLDSDGVRNLMRVCCAALGESGMTDFIATLRREAFTSVDAGIEDAEVTRG